MLQLLFGISMLASASSPVLVHELVACAALLTDPSFEEVGRRIPRDEPWPIDDLPLWEVPHGLGGKPLGAERGLETFYGAQGFKAVNTIFSREFVGDEDIAKFVGAVRARAQSLQVGLDADPAVPDWDWYSKRLFAVQAVLPTLLLAAQAYGIYGLYQSPESIWWALPLQILTTGGASVVIKDMYRDTLFYLRALGRKDVKPYLHRNSPEYQSPVQQFLRDVVRANEPLHWFGPKLWATTTREVSALAFEPLRADDVDVARDNYENLLHAALAEAIATPPKELVMNGRFVEIDFHAFRHPDTGAKHLRVHVRFVKPGVGPEGRDPRERRPLPANEAPAGERGTDDLVPRGA